LGGGKFRLGRVFERHYDRWPALWRSAFTCTTLLQALA
jgi:hypothetical protein